MWAARNSSIKRKDLILALLEAMQLLTQVVHGRGHQKMGSLKAKGTAKLIKLQKGQLGWSLEPEQIMVLVIAPHAPGSLTFLRIPHSNKKRLNNGAMRKETSSSMRRMTSCSSLRPQSGSSPGVCMMSPTIWQIHNGTWGKRPFQGRDLREQ